MGKIVYLCGKSSSGKDTIFKELLQREKGRFCTIVPYTTRPIREGEENGVEYFFTDEEGFQSLLGQGKVIEHREYHTVKGLWRYFTVDDGQIDLERASYLTIGTLESLQGLYAYFGADKVVPILIDLDDGVRLQRALDRETKSGHREYLEMCRRFLADSEDFTEEKILAAGITTRFWNDDLERCLGQIEEYLKRQLEAQEKE